MIYERRTLNGDRVDTIKIPLDVPPEMVDKYAQDGYTEVMECFLVLYKPRIPQEEAVRYKEAVDKLASIDLSTALKADLVAVIEEVRDPSLVVAQKEDIVAKEIFVRK